jgi:hypothetical protein
MTRSGRRAQAVLEDVDTGDVKHVNDFSHTHIYTHTHILTFFPPSHLQILDVEGLIWICNSVVSEI